MASFTELSRREQKMVFTTVQYDFGQTEMQTQEDGTAIEVPKYVEVEVAHFNPASEEEIQQSLNNRMISEGRALDIEL